jgi:hypothetical protein
MIYRLKTRLALANFKRLYGYERYDLYTLESNLILKAKKKQLKKKTTNRHRYYPTTTTTISNTAAIQSSHLLSPTQLAYPLSEKRSTSPHQHYKKEPTDEDAANLLVMLHNTSSA